MDSRRHFSSSNFLREIVRDFFQKRVSNVSIHVKYHSSASFGVKTQLFVGGYNFKTGQPVSILGHVQACPTHFSAQKTCLYFIQACRSKTSFFFARVEYNSRRTRGAEEYWRQCQNGCRHSDEWRSGEVARSGLRVEQYIIIIHNTGRPDWAGGSKFSFAQKKIIEPM